MKITFNNYYLDTRGTFTFIGNVDTFYKSSRYGVKVLPQKHFKEIIAQLLKIEIRDVKHNYTSFNYFFKSASIYFEIKGTTKLVRISDHWSKSINLDSINECGLIRSCWWELRRKNQKQVNSTKYQIGIIDLKKLRKNS